MEIHKRVDVLAALELFLHVHSDDPNIEQSGTGNMPNCGNAVEADADGEIINFFLADNAMSPYIPMAFIYRPQK